MLEGKTNTHLEEFNFEEKRIERRVGEKVQLSAMKRLICFFNLLPLRFLLIFKQKKRKFIFIKKYAIYLFLSPHLHFTELANLTVL
jgi:hypothetical protein